MSTPSSAPPSRLQTGGYACVAFMARPHLRRMSIEIAQRLKKLHGSRTLMYCTTPQEAAYYMGTGAFDAAPLHEMVTPENLGQGSRSDILQRARRIEAEYGVTMNHIALTNRHLGRGFALGGFYHPRSRLSESATYDDLLAMLCQQVEYYEQQIAKEGITLFLNASWLPSLILKRLGIPMRSLVFARIGSRYMWAHDGLDQTPLLPLAYERLADRTDLLPPELAAPNTHLDFRARTLRARSTLRLVKDLGYTIAQQIYWRLRGYKKANGYFLSERLSSRLRQWRDLRDVTGPKTVSLKDLEDRPFIFYPLHTEPEKALQTLSPLHFYQLSAIAGLARDLPAGVLLVVKEHAIATGRRPQNFYDQIREFKNVCFLNMAELGVDIVQQAAAIATITSTAGLEGAMAGKPVITFGRHNTYNILPHVRLVTDEATLKPAIEWALSGQVNPEVARRDAGRFAAALESISFTLPGFSEGRPDEAPMEAVEAALQHLNESLLSAPYGLPTAKIMSPS